MKERPIPFSGPMVRAILDGCKTQTRRVAKLVNSRQDGRGFLCLKRPGSNLVLPEIEGKWQWQPVGGEPWQPYPRIAEYCPYGQPGDRLWVRESFGLMPTQYEFEKWVVYQADGMAHRAGMADDEDVHYRPADLERLAEWTPRSWAGERPKYRPSIRMPRWASRITLEIVAVRIERLQDISDADAIAEGCPESAAFMASSCAPGLPRHWYSQLWDKINGPDSWNANPWVWVIEFLQINPQSQEDAA